MTDDPNNARLISIVADPGISTVAAQRVASHLTQADFPTQACFEVTTERLSIDQMGNIDIRSIARRLMQSGSVSLVICFTDQPEGAGHSPVAVEVLANESAILVSLPAFGAFNVVARVEKAVVALVKDRFEEAVADENTLALLSPEHLPGLKRLDDKSSNEATYYVSGGLSGQFHLVFGLVKDNRPWRLVPNMTGAFAAAAATSGYLLITSTVWQTAMGSSPTRLALLSLISIASMSMWIIFRHGMWDRAKRGSGRRLATYYNLSTVVSVSFGVASIFAILTAATLAISSLVIAPGVVARNVGHTMTFSDRVSIIVFVSSIATIAGAVGSTFEKGDRVRDAAYGFRQRERQYESQDQSQNDYA